MEKIQLNDSTQESLKQNIKRLAAFGVNPRDDDAWSNASSAIGELGNISTRYLAGNDIEDIAFSSSMTRLSEAVEELHRSYKNVEAKQDYELALGDIRYRIKRLFGVVAE